MYYASEPLNFSGSQIWPLLAAILAAILVAILNLKNDNKTAIP